jgi:hypothetical protein
MGQGVAQGKVYTVYRYDAEKQREKYLELRGPDLRG